MISVGVLINGCEKSNIQKSKLSGLWIEAVNKLDTIDFNETSPESSFNLKRGLIKVNDSFVPDYGSGYYGYELLDNDSISLCYSVSSSCIIGVLNSYSKYYFQLFNTDSIKIGNFYNPKIDHNNIITFYKAKL